MVLSAVFSQFSPHNHVWTCSEQCVLYGKTAVVIIIAVSSASNPSISDLFLQNGSDGNVNLLAHASRTLLLLTFGSLIQGMYITEQTKYAHCMTRRALLPFTCFHGHSSLLH